jgi:tetratricopeptide (TPR) repeat protein
LKRRANKKEPGRRTQRNDASGPTPSALPNPGRQWLFRLLAIALLPIVTFGVLEIGLRIGGYGYPTGFFKTSHIGDRDYLVNNEEYGFRFFPAELSRFSGPIRIEADKPPDTFRIFILGESAAMGDPEPSFGASRYLEVLLRERFPQQKFEVVNVAITAINSHVILPIARDCARHQGDLWIIYMGNNEMVGPFGAATVFGAQAPPLALVRLSLAVQRTRTGQLLMALARKLRGKAASASSWGGMEMFIGNQLPPDSPRKQTVYRNFQHNLRDILRAGLDSGAKVILNTVAVNLKDCPPFASLSNSNRPPSQRAAFEQLYADASAASAQSNQVAAVPLFEQAAKVDPSYAELQYRWGLSLLAQTNLSAAREHLQEACDTDALPFRTDSTINGLIREEAGRYAGPNLVLLDAAAILPTNQAAAVCGRETFYEHVHFNFAGNYRLGLLWAQQVEKALPSPVTSKAAGPWASQKTCDRLLGLSDWNRALVLQSVIRRFSQPPLSSQFNNVQRRQAIEEQIRGLKQQMTPAAAPAARKTIEEAIQHAPADHYLHEVFAEFLQSTGDLAEATRQWQTVHELLPQDFLSYYQLGRLYSLQGLWPQAETCLSQVVAAHSGMIEAWHELGNVHFGQEQYQRALADYEEARKRRPRDPKILCDLGKTLAKLKRRPQAIACFREAIQFNPDDWDAHFQLAGELSFDGKIPEAQAEFAEAVRIQPGNPRSRFNLGVMFAKQNQFDAATREFQETLRLEPGNQTAAMYLAQIKALKGAAPSPPPASP